MPSEFDQRLAVLEEELKALIAQDRQRITATEAQGEAILIEVARDRQRISTLEEIFIYGGKRCTDGL
ncbi:MAG: hypothetical protein WC291_08025 [Thermodesulfovibrionales bacterium]|jgi:hypothetical protein